MENKGVENKGVLVFLEEEYGYARYLWKTTLTKEELIQKYTSLESTSQFFFSALGIVKEFGGTVAMVDMNFKTEKWIRSTYLSVDEVYDLMDDIDEEEWEEFDLNTEEQKASDHIFMHLHMEDDSYLWIEGTTYHHKGRNNQ